MSNNNEDNNTVNETNDEELENDIFINDEEDSNDNSEEENNEVDNEENKEEENDINNNKEEDVNNEVDDNKEEDVNNELDENTEFDVNNDVDENTEFDADNEENSDNEKNADNDNENKLEDDKIEVDEDLNDDSDSDSELDADFFNLDDNSDDDDLFNTKVITKNEIEVVPEEERTYKNIAYEKDLFDTFITEYPLYQRTQKYIENRIYNKIKNILDLKDIGLEKINLYNDNIHYNVVKKYLDDNFNEKWIIPIVADDKVIFSNISSSSDNDNNSNILITNTQLDSDIIKKDQRFELKEIKTLDNEYKKNNIQYAEYMKKKYKILLPYIENNEFDTGKSIKMDKTTFVLRESNIDNIFWQQRAALGKLETNIEVIDSETNEILKVEDKTIIPGENTRIIGFYILPFAHNNINDCLIYSEQKKKVMGRYGLLGKVTNISVSNPAVITVKNHGLEDGQRIYLTNTNSFPSINGSYQSSVKVLNKDSFSVDVSTVDGKEGNKGFLFGNLNLEYETYNVNLNGNKIDISKKNNDKNNSLNENKYELPKLFLFKNIKVDNNEIWKSILNKVIPSISKIISMEIPYLKDCNTYEDMKNILKKYSLNFNDLDKNQYKVLQNILADKPEKLIKEYNSINITEKKSLNKDNFLFSDSEFLFSNKFITNPEIIKYYGKYSELDSIDDSIQNRINWVMDKPDLGNLYFKIVLKEVNKNLDKIKDKVINQKKVFEEEYNELLNEFQKEEKINNYLKKEEECQNANYNDLQNDNWKDALNKTGKDHKKGRQALVNKNGVPTIFVWNGEKWEENQTFNSKYKVNTSSNVNINVLKKICEFKNENLENIDLNQLSCLFRNTIGCHSRKYVYYKDKLEKYKKKVENFEKLSEYLKNKDYEKDVNNSLQLITNTYNIINENNNTNLNNNNKSNNNDTSDNNNSNNENEEVKSNINNIKLIKPNKVINEKEEKLNKLLKKINEIKNVDERTYLLNKVITYDGMMVGKDIYSIKYGAKIICGHHYYKMLINKANNIDEKDNLSLKMIQIYGDDGQTDKEFETCTNCGESLRTRRYDETEGFTSFGALAMSRAIWEEDKGEDILYEIGKKTSTMEEEFTTEMCRSTQFKDDMIKKGFTYKSLEKIHEICEILVNICAKSGVVLLKKDVYDILIDCSKILDKKLTLNEFINLEKKKLKQAGKDQSFIDDLERKGKFRLIYDKKISTGKYTVIASRLLITLQTSIPPYSRTVVSGLCPFTSFEEDEGKNYFVCILEKMLKNFRIDPDREKRVEIITDLFNNNYNDFKKFKNINDLFLRYSTFKQKQEKLIEKIKNDIEKNIIYNKIDKLEDNLDKKIREVNSSNQLNEKQIKIIKRLNYLTNEIKNNVSMVIRNSPINEVITASTENSCCDEETKELISYFTYISLESDKTIIENIKETNELYDTLGLFNKAGYVTQFYIEEKKDLAINNKIIVGGLKSDSENIEVKDLKGKVLFNNIFEKSNIITKKKLMFVIDGEKVGERRSFSKNIENSDLDLDMVSGKTRKEINEMKLSDDEYFRLLYNISKLRFTIFSDYQKFYDKYEELINNLLGSINSNLVTNIDKLFDRIKKLLKKDDSFIEKYKNFLKNIGLSNENNNNDGYKKQS